MDYLDDPKVGSLTTQCRQATIRNDLIIHDLGEHGGANSPEAWPQSRGDGSSANL
jgi:hypothetical protein